MAENKIEVQMNLPEAVVSGLGSYDVSTSTWTIEVTEPTTTIVDYTGYSSNPWRDESVSVSLDRGVWTIYVHTETGSPIAKPWVTFSKIK